MKRILVLYRELAGYFVQCINSLCDEYHVEADIIAYPVNPDAPFRFDFSSRVHIEDRASYTDAGLSDKVHKGNYDLVFVGGWSDKGYLNAVRKKKSAAISLLGFDTWWSGTVRQRLAVMYARKFISPYFNFAFVPGVEQAELARRMGFHSGQVITGAYAADVKKFIEVGQARKTRPDIGHRNLIYAGRYAPEKFIQPLCDAMVELWNEGERNWRLLCVGTGPLFATRRQHESIAHHGFLQPSELTELMKNGDAFILPSTFEPWGVVVHEFAAAGYPLILSSSVGARNAFLHHGENGYIFPSGNTAELKNVMRLMFSRSQMEMVHMGELSAELAQKITPDTWAKSIFELM